MCEACVRRVERDVTKEGPAGVVEEGGRGGGWKFGFERERRFRGAMGWENGGCLVVFASGREGRVVWEGEFGCQGYIPFFGLAKL